MGKQHNIKVVVTLSIFLNGEMTQPGESEEKSAGQIIFCLNVWLCDCAGWGLSLMQDPVLMSHSWLLGPERESITRCYLRHPLPILQEMCVSSFMAQPLLRIRSTEENVIHWTQGFDLCLSDFTPLRFGKESRLVPLSVPFIWSSYLYGSYRWLVYDKKN